MEVCARRPFNNPGRIEPVMRFYIIGCTISGIYVDHFSFATLAEALLVIDDLHASGCRATLKSVWIPA